MRVTLCCHWRTLSRVGSGANPSYTPDELGYQVQATKPAVVIAHPDALRVALAATRAITLPAERIVLFNVDGASYGTHATVQDVIDEGLASITTFEERVLRPGEGKTKIAFLNFSSGTTGRPKVCLGPLGRRVGCLTFIGYCDTPLCADS